MGEITFAALNNQADQILEEIQKLQLQVIDDRRLLPVTKIQRVIELQRVAEKLEAEMISMGRRLFKLEGQLEAVKINNDLS